jgi:hypothetical protein
MVHYSGQSAKYSDAWVPEIHIWIIFTSHQVVPRV